jgi:hypothetical protein
VKPFTPAAAKLSASSRQRMTALRSVSVKSACLRPSFKSSTLLFSHEGVRALRAALGREVLLEVGFPLPEGHAELVARVFDLFDGDELRGP